MPALIDITGKRFGRLTVMRRYDSKRWECLCDCGNITISDGYQLRRGITKSCGCYQRTNAGDVHRKHGYCGTRLYRIYYKMKERCYRPENDNFKYYGGRGIKICDEWLQNFSSFADWAVSNGYADNLTIDRKDNEKGYSPDNCRWVTMAEQQRNKRKRGTLTWQ